jgi:hypothetical protein
VAEVKVSMNVSGFIESFTGCSHLYPGKYNEKNTMATGFFVVDLLPAGGAEELCSSRTDAENRVLVIYPYRYQGTWVFDDPGVGLIREPFVAGIPEMIDRLVKDIPDAGKGFRLLFSDAPFPGYSIKVVWQREEAGGNWYYCEQYDSEGWLCPALFEYFKDAPKEIYAKAEKK